VLIRNAAIDFGRRRVDLRVEGAHIVELAPRLDPRAGETQVDARGNALVPGLHDHHVHLYATAVAMRSLDCGPPAVRDREQLARAVARACAGDGSDWIRGTGYHESVAGLLDRAELDAWAPRRPLRIQHRSGRLWMLNTVGLERLGVHDHVREGDPLERQDGRPTGRLYDSDAWLRTRIGGQRPPLHELSQQLLRRGITGVTDTGHANDVDTFAALEASVAARELEQHLAVMGDASLDALEPTSPDARVLRGAHKFHLHDHALPPFATLCDAVRRSHAVGRGAAFHCVTRGELVFALAVLAEAGSIGRDRIEHAGLVAPELFDELLRLRLRVVTQPHFIAERGDAYRRDVDATEHADLYRLRSLLDAGVPLAAGSDAPYGSVDPWSSMAAAVTRCTPDGQVLGASESLAPEQALQLFLAPLDDPGGLPRQVEVGAYADLCLLDRPWAGAREALGDVRIRRTWVRGTLCWNGDEFL
jgi:predicted amidohydrolase YtcJ